MPGNWKNVSISEDLWERLGDYHRQGSRPRLLEAAFAHYEKHVLKKQEVKQ